MKIGDKVVVAEHTIIKEFVGKTGIIVEERIPQSQFSMLMGQSSWIVQFDEPMHIEGTTINQCNFREDSLMLRV